MDPKTQSYNMNSQGMTPPPGEKKVGPIVATLIIVLVLIIAALYLFASKIGEPVVPVDTAGTAQNSSANEDADTVKAVTSASTEINDLQADLDGSINGLDNNNF